MAIVDPWERHRGRNVKGLDALKNWKPFWGTKILEVSMGRVFGALKGSNGN